MPLISELPAGGNVGGSMMLTNFLKIKYYIFLVLKTFTFLNLKSTFKKYIYKLESYVFRSWNAV